MESYDTLVEALNDLKAKGYTLDFNLQEKCIECNETGPLDPNKFEITRVYRFEGMTNPADSSVLYVIEGHKGEKGTLVDAYGAYSSSLSPEMARKLSLAR